MNMHSKTEEELYKYAEKYCDGWKMETGREVKFIKD